MESGTIKLSYRELGQRLGLSVDAARMLAKRREKAGLWRIHEGNHPNDTKMVELPEAALNKPERIAPDEKARRGDNKGEVKAGTYDPSPLAEHFATALAEAQGQVKDLTTQLMSEKDAHRQTAIELAQAETREAGMAAEIERLEDGVRILKGQLRYERRSWWQKMMSTR